MTHASRQIQAPSGVEDPIRATTKWQAKSVATVDNALKLKLEHLLGMSGGYVLNYSNASFAAFVRDSIGVDPYELHNGSKAQVLRHLWFALSDSEFAQLTIDMLEYRRLAEDLGHLERSDRIEADRQLSEDVIGQLRALLEPAGRLTGDEAAFLARVVEFDLSQVAVTVDLQSVVADRLEEVETCYENGAYLAVVILCGSTLEGLLYEVAKSHPADYNRTSAAPRHDGKVRPFPEWTLSDLLNCSREIGLLGEDVTKFGHAVREFRNYIHPQQQVKEDFRPRRVTAQVARQVLRAAIDDLASQKTSFPPAPRS
jgi:hypothetical protein